MIHGLRLPQNELLLIMSLAQAVLQRVWGTCETPCLFIGLVPTEYETLRR